MRRMCMLFLILGVCLCGAVNAQVQKPEVCGVVLDSLSLQPEMYATIRIFRLPDKSKPVAAFVSDDKGLFCSVVPGKGKYSIRITSIGKETLSDDFEIGEGELMKKLGQFRMRDDVTQLSEISVVAMKPLVKAEVDKTSYSIEDDPDSETKTILEMLRKVPLLTVDGNDDIKVNGSSNFKIYMNNKPSNMLSGNPKEVLRSIPASTIKKIEVITEPGARYDAEGVSGVLNIITQGAEFEGYNASLNTVMMQNQKVFGGFASLKYGRFSLSANYSYSEYRNKLKSDYRRMQFNKPEEEVLSRQSDTKMKSPGNYGALESSFEIDSLNLITVSGSMDIGTSKYSSKRSFQMQDTYGNPVYAYNQTDKVREHWGNASVKTDYQHTFKRNKDEVFTASYQYDYMPNDMFTNLNLMDLIGESSSLQYLRNYNRQSNIAKRNEHTFQADYVNSFASKHSLEGGMKYILRNNVSDATSEVRMNAQDAWELAAFQPLVEYEHIQNILAAYTGYTLKSDKWSLNGGIRLEHTWQKVLYKQGNGSDFDYKLTDWVPSFSALYKLSDRNQVRLSYNLRVRRPGIDFLNPYVMVSGTEIAYGNPGLTSEKHHRMTASYNYLSPKINIQAVALYSLNRKGTAEYQFIDKNGVLNRTYDNIENVNAVSISGYMGYNPTPTTTLSVNGSLNYLYLWAESGVHSSLSDLHNEGFCGSVFVDFSQKFKYGWRLACSAGYFRPEVTLGRQSPTYYYYGVNLAKSFLDDKLTVMLRTVNFAKPYYMVILKENYQDFTTTQKNRSYSQDFGISVTYRFGSLKEVVKKVVRSIENDDVKKVKN